MKKNVLLSAFVLVASFATSSAMAGAPEVESLKDVAVAQLNDDGTYSVVCTNGNREHVTATDVRIGNVCPHSESSVPTEILSLQRRADGQFDVVCRDLTKVVATEEEILGGKVCEKKTPSVVIEDGVYAASGSQDCKINASYTDNKLVGLRAEFSPSVVANMTCVGNICSGKFSGFPQTYQFKILSRTSFEYSYQGSRTIIFTKR